MFFQRWIEAVSFAVVTLMTAGLLIGVGKILQRMCIPNAKELLIVKP